MKKPRLAPEGVKLKVSAETVLHAVKSVLDAGKEAEFLDAARKQDAFVVVTPDVVNLVKQFLFDRGIHEMSMAASNVVHSPRGKDRCPPADP